MRLNGFSLPGVLLLATVVAGGAPGHEAAPAPGDAWVPRFGGRGAPRWEHGLTGPRVAEARQQYIDSAEHSPIVAEWLLLRAASLSRDSLERQDIYGRIHTPVVRSRILPTEALVREELGDFAGAAARYDSLGQLADATRLWLKLARTREQQRALRAGLVAVVREYPAGPQAQDAVDFLSSIAVELAPQEALESARLAKRQGNVAAAVPLYEKARAGGVLGPADLLDYGNALAQDRRYRQAIREYQRLKTDSTLSREAEYRSAWAASRLGQTGRVRETLERLLARIPDDAAVRPKALFLAGTLAWQAGQRDTALARWNELLQRFPQSDSAARAGFLSGLALYEEGGTTEAASLWERVHRLGGRADGLAAGYWAGRAWSEAGDTARAVGLWRSVIAQDSTSYYAVLSARRLDLPTWRPRPELEEFRSFADVDSAVDRVRELRDLGMDEEAQYEIDWLIGARERSVERLLSVGDAFRRAGEPAAAVAAARRAIGLGAPPDTRTYRLLYPREFGDHIEANAAAAGLDPLLVTALIRQESGWQTRARSHVGALGLMQVMPATGRLIARSLRIHGYHPDQLFEPETNLRFGIWYLAQSLHEFGNDVARALAAYNAGANRAKPWATGRAATDSELFVERIALRETRDYVRIITRNLALYRVLYGG